MAAATGELQASGWRSASVPACCSPKAMLNGCPASFVTESTPPPPQIERVPCLSDNYSWLLHEPQQGATAVVDPAEVEPVVAALEARGWRLTHILNTHHHWDHVGGNEALKARYGCTVVGPAADAARIPGIDVQLKDGDRSVGGIGLARPDGWLDG